MSIDGVLLRIDLNIRCAFCRKELTGTSRDEVISVEPCQHCLDVSRDEGYNDGYEVGRNYND